MLLIIAGGGLWAFFYFQDLPLIIKKYPEPFNALKDDILPSTLIRFINTYDTLSAGQYKVDQNSATSRNCKYLRLSLPKDERLVKLISDASYKYHNKGSSGSPYIRTTTFTNIGAKCTSESKLINLKYKGNEAHATFSCENGDLVEEFTYSSTDSKCGVVEYKKEWGIKPIERTLGYTTSLIIF